MATRLGYVTRDQKVQGSNPVWVAAVWTNTSGSLFMGCLHINGLVVCTLESVKKSRGLYPGSGFLSVADMSMTVTNK